MNRDSRKLRAPRTAGAALVVAVLPAALAVASPQAVTLRWSFDEGQHRVYRMTTSQETEMPDGSGVMVAESAMTMSWDVVEVNEDGDASVRITTDRVQMRIQTPMGNVDADSAEDPVARDPVARAATALAGTSYTMVFDDSGDVKEVLGLEAMRERFVDAMGQQSNPMSEQLVDQMATEEGIKGMLGRGIFSFPPEPLQPGDSWEANFDFDVPMFGGVTNTSIMRLDRIEPRNGDRIAVIEMSGDMIFTPEGNTGGSMVGAMRMGDATITGDMEWNVDLGMLVRSNTRTTIEIEMTAGAQQMDFVTTLVQRMELVEEG